jgi:hypothetical protein
MFRDLVRLWRDHAGLDVLLEDVFGEFVIAWAKVRYPIGQNPLARIMDRIEGFPAEAVANEGEQTRRLVAICRQMQADAGEGPFFLSSRVAADALGADRMQVHRWLRVMQADGLLQVAEKGTATRATRYRYLGSVDGAKRRGR